MHIKMMKSILVTGMLSAGMLVFSGAAAQGEGSVRLAASKPGLIRFTVRIDSSDVSIIQAEAADRLRIRGFAAAGKPGTISRPMRAVTLALPHGARPEITWRVLDERLVRTTRPQVLPVLDAGTGRIIEHAHPVAEDDLPLIRVAELGQQGQTYVAVLEVRPARYDAGRKAWRIATHVQVDVRYEEPRRQMMGRALGKSTGGAVPAGILNPVQARVWGGESPGQVQQESELADSLIARVVVEKEGWYAITGSMLEEAGIDLSGIALERLGMSYRRSPIPILIEGDNDGSFDPDDRILFRGDVNHGPQTWLSQYIDENVYALSLYPQPAMRFAETDGGLYSRNAEEKSWYLATRRFEEDHEFDRLLQQYNQDADHWFWYILTAGGSETITFTLEGPFAEEGTAQLSFSAMGLTHIPRVYPDHSIALLLNGVPVADTLWDGQREVTVEGIHLPAGLLREGENTLEIKAPGDSPAREIDKFFFNWFEIVWPRKTVPVFDVIELPSGELNQPLTYTLTGFSTHELLVFDSFNRRIANFFLRQEDDRTWTLRFQDPSPQQGKTYYVVGKDGFAAPPRVEPVPAFEPLRTTSRGADYLIVTHEKFRQGLEPLIQHRRQQGYRIEVAEVQQIYDEFSGGNYGPQGIRDLVRYAWEHWQKPRPKYLLLVGDTHSFFRKGKYRDGRGDFVPTFLAYTVSWGMSASDNYFVQVAGDDIMPDLAIGRFPVNDETELRAIVDKTLAYETRPSHGRWRGEIHLSAGDDPLFENQTEYLYENYVPDAYRVTRVYTNEKTRYYGSTEELIDAFDRGALFMNFVGHGGGGVFADDQLFLLDDSYLIRNRYRWTVLLTWSCFIGYFDNPGSPSLGETLLRLPNNGTIANFGASGRAWLVGDRYFNGEFFNQIFNQDENLRLGELAMRAKVDLFFKYGQRDLVLNYNIIGDPALKIPYPEETLSLQNKQQAVQPGAPVEITGTAPGATGGEVVLELYHKEDILLDSVRVANTADGFSAALSLPDTVNGAGIVRAYFTDGTRHQIGATRFSADTVHFGEVILQPERPRHQQPFYISVPVSALQGTRIDSVVLYPGKKVDPNTRILMTRVANSPELVYRAEQQVQTPDNRVYYFRLGLYGAYKGTPLQKITSLLYIQLDRRPDLRFASNTFTFSGWKPAEVKFAITNRGDFQTEAFSVGFAVADGGSLANSTFLAARNIPGMAPGDTQTVRLNWQTPTPGLHDFVFALDIDDSVDEWSDGNNRYQVSRVIATPDQGSDGLVFDRDSTFSIAVPAQAVTELTALELRGWSPARDAQVVIPGTLEFLPLRSGRSGYYGLLGGESTGLRFLREVEARLYFRKDDPAVRTALSEGSLRVSWLDFTSMKFTTVPFQIDESGGFVSVRIPATGALALVRLRDQQGPQVEIRVAAQNFTSGDYVGSNPEFTISIDDESGVYTSAGFFQLSLNGEPVSDDALRTVLESEQGRAVVLSFQPELEPGEHTLSLSIRDRAGNQTEKEIKFTVADAVTLRALANHPNPFADETVIAYTLTGEAESVSLKIYSVSGRLIREWSFFNEAGYAEHIWDGRDENGEQVANGVYYLRFRARMGDETIERIQKIARLR